MTELVGPRLLRNRDEARALCRFIQACHGGVWQPGVYDVGDVWWYLASHPSEGIAIWEDRAGDLLGFAWLEAPDGFIMHIRPDLRGQGALEEAMTAWAATAQPTDTISTRAFEGDRATVSWLVANGFTQDSSFMVPHRRDMALPIPDSTLPSGFVVRHVLPNEFEERVEAHRDAFHPSKFTLEKYLLARNAPDYDPELDIVAVAPDGTIASFCIAWYDSVNQIGYFEPVGTRAAFRGQRLGQNMLHEALRRLRERGAREAVVASGGSNTAARRLYQSVGFVDADIEWQYNKVLNR